MSEQGWRLVWASWVAAFIVAETIALRSGQKHAPLSPHMRHALGVKRRGQLHHRVGQIAYATGVSWLAAHLWKAVSDDG